MTTTALYQDFPAFLDALPADDRALLARSRALFCYPVLGRNEFELAEHPISQRVLMATLRAVGTAVAGEIALMGDGPEILFQPSSEQPPDLVVIHPMIGVLDHLPALVHRYRERFPNAKLVLQTSDQHQHEKLIGGPRSAEVAAVLLAQLPEIDHVINGFAEHGLLSLLLGQPSRLVIGRNGAGEALPSIFLFDSLPDAALPDAAPHQDRSIRVQRARGCPAPCSYCIEGQANRTVVGERSWDAVATERFVERLTDLERRGFFFINVIDSSFEGGGPKGLREMMRFCEAVIDRGLKLSFKIHLRAESVLKLDSNALLRLKQAGVDVIVCGLESGSQIELDFFRKLASKQQSLDAFTALEAEGHFCNILGYMMFSPIASLGMLDEKIEFLRRIGRGWDFLNLTNRVLVFWGTAMHRQLMELGLADERLQLGYVNYCYRDDGVGRLDHSFNRLKRERPGFPRLNNLIYDALNLSARIRNPANARYRELAGSAFDRFEAALAARRRWLNDVYCDGFQDMIRDPDRPFLRTFDIDGEAERQRQEILDCLSFVDRLPERPTTLYLKTWLSAVNRFGTSIP